MRIWLHKWEGNAWGWSAWSLDDLGFATWAPSRTGVLDRVPRKFEEHGEWLSEQGPRTFVGSAANDFRARDAIVPAASLGVSPQTEETGT